jgi:hypothetical protein
MGTFTALDPEAVGRLGDALGVGLSVGSGVVV